MTTKFENPPPISREQLEKALATGDGPTAADAIIRMALWESDPRWAEQKSMSALKDDRKEVRGAALVSIGHLARLHRALNLAVIIPAITKLLDDPESRAAAEDALEDIAMFMPDSPQGSNVAL